MSAVDVEATRARTACPATSSADNFSLAGEAPDEPFIIRKAETSGFCLGCQPVREGRLEAEKLVDWRAETGTLRALPLCIFSCGPRRRPNFGSRR